MGHLLRIGPAIGSLLLLLQNTSLSAGPEPSLPAREPELLEFGQPSRASRPRAVRSPVPEARPAASACPPARSEDPRIGLPPPGLDPYYSKAVPGVIPVYAPAGVCDRYLQIAARAVGMMFAARPELSQKLGSRGVAVVISSENERVTDVPAFWDLKAPDRRGTYDHAAGIFEALGPIVVWERDFVGVASAGAWATPTLFHELGHAVDYLFLEHQDHQMIVEEFRKGRAQGWHRGDYVMTNPEEFFAGAVAAWFTRVPIRPTRDEYKAAFPRLYALLEDLF